MARGEFALHQQIHFGFAHELRSEECQRIGLAFVVAGNGDRQRLTRRLTKIENFGSRRSDEAEPLGQCGWIAGHGMRCAPAQQRTLGLDHQRRLLGVGGKRQRFRNHDVGADSRLSQCVDPAAQRRASDHGDGDARASDRVRQREMQFLDRAGQLVFQRERHGLGKLCAAHRHGVGLEQDDMFGRHEHDDALRTRKRGCRRRAGIRAGYNPAAGILDEPAQLAVGMQSDQQSFGHVTLCGVGFGRRRGIVAAHRRRFACAASRTACAIGRLIRPRRGCAPARECHRLRRPQDAARSGCRT